MEIGRAGVTLAEGTEKQEVIKQLIADGYEQLADITIPGIKVYLGAKKSRERTVTAFLSTSKAVINNWWRLTVLFAWSDKPEKVYVVKRDINPAQVSSITWMEKEEE